MVSTVLITISAFLFKLSPGNNLDVNSNEKNTIQNNIQPKIAQISLSKKPLAEKPNATFENKTQENINVNKPEELIFAFVNTASNVAQEPTNNVENKKDNTKIPQTETQTCNWPSDTIIDKKNLLVELSDSELFEIGIVKNGKEMYYNNEGDDGLSTDYAIPVEKRIKTYYNFHLKFISTINYIPFSSYNGTTTFYLSLDTLVPVILRSHGARSGEIMWFNPHPTLFEKLPERFKYLKDIYLNLKCLKMKYPTKSFTNYLSPVYNVISPVNPIKLNREELKKIGINIGTKTIKIKYGENDIRDQCIYHFDIVRLPIFRTDTLGRKISVITPENQKIAEKYFDVLIPVLVNYTLNDGAHTEYCWYYPSDEFIQLLPDRIKHELKLERDAIISNQKVASSECTYFEACRSTLDTKLKLFPNPAKTSVTLEFESAEDMTGSISLVNISGAVVKQLLPSAFIHSGKNSFTLELSGVGSGIYLVYVNTNKGFVTQKLIVN